MPGEQPLSLEVCLNQAAIINTAYETLEYFPDDEQMRGEIRQIIEDARYELQEWIAEFMRGLERMNSEAWGTNFTEVRRLIVTMAEHGILGPAVFGEGDWLRVNLPPGMTVEIARTMDGFTLFLDVLRSVHSRLSDRAFLIDPAAFRFLIYGNLAALQFALLASSGPDGAE